MVAAMAVPWLSYGGPIPATWPSPWPPMTAAMEAHGGASAAAMVDTTQFHGGPYRPHDGRHGGHMAAPWRSMATHGGLMATPWRPKSEPMAPAMAVPCTPHGRRYGCPHGGPVATPLGTPWGPMAAAIAAFWQPPWRPHAGPMSAAMAVAMADSWRPMAAAMADPWWPVAAPWRPHWGSMAAS